MNRGRFTYWLLALLIVAPLLVYLPSVLRDGFVSIDDGLLITKNAAVQSLSFGTLWHIFTSYDPELYIPLTLFTYQIEWALAGAQPILFHLTNLLLHIGSGVFLFFLLQLIFNRGQNAHAGLSGTDIVVFFGALLFVLHPVHTEAIAWAAARKDVLSAFFFLGSLYFYEQWRQERKEGTPWWSLLFFLFALLSKVTVVLLPLLLILLDWRRGDHIDVKNLRVKTPFFAASGLFIVIALFGKAQGIGSLGLWKTGLLSAKAVLFYLQTLLWPTHLSVLYAQTTPVVLSSPEFLVPVVGVLCLLLVTGVSIMGFSAMGAPPVRPYKNVAFGLMFFLLTVIPNFANFWKNRFLFFASDRYAYLPSIGLIIILCAGALWLMRRKSLSQSLLLTGFGAVAAVFAVLTFLQARVWQSDFALYENVLRWHPDSAQAANNLGDAYVKAGKPEEALPWFAQAADHDPGYIQAMVNAGNIERERGRLEESQAWYERGIASIGPDPRIEDLAPRYLLGELLMKMGKSEDALTHFRLAAEALPTVAEPFYNWGIQLQSLGRNDEAMPLFEKAVTLNPQDIASRYHLAGLYAERGRLAEAKNQLEAVVRVDPQYEKAAEHLEAIRRLLSQ